AGFDSAEQMRRLRVRLADALVGAGHGAEAGREYLASAQGASAIESLELQRRSALHFLRAGHIDDGLGVLRSVRAAVGLSRPSSPRRTFWGLVWHRVLLRLRGIGFRRREADQIPPEELIRLDVCLAAAVGLSMVNVIQGAYYQTRALRLALA